MCCQDKLSGKMAYRKSMTSTQKRTSLYQRQKSSLKPSTTKQAFIAPPPMYAKEYKTQDPLRKMKA